jgi:hypothetical protein
MLSPHERVSLLDALRPPAGFTLDAAVGTSFTLDLEALLTAPIAFALFEASEAEPDDPSAEPVGLLEAIRRYASRITVFCQAGQIALPTRHRAVFAWLEEAVVEIRAPRPHHLFHPKVWLGRYREVRSDRQMLRVLCATRNLTLDNSWDTLLRLESEPREPGQDAGVALGNAALAAFFARLAELGTHPISIERTSMIRSLASDLEHTPLLPPEPFDRVTFEVLGLDSDARGPFPEGSDRAVVVSPFLSESFLERFVQSHRVAALVSREESLDRINPRILNRVDRLAVLNAAVDLAPPEVDRPASATSNDEAVVPSEAVDPNMTFGGLHAKLFAFDTTEDAIVVTGSANATEAAFDGNIEVVAVLHGPRAAGVSALLAESSGETTLSDLLVDYRPLERANEETDQDKLELELDELRRRLAEVVFTATIGAEADHYRLRLRGSRAMPSLDADEFEIVVWPMTLAADQSGIGFEPARVPDATFDVSFEGITSFFGIRLSARRGSARHSTTSLVNAVLEGGPADRHARLLAAMLRDPDRLLRYLLLLLADEDTLSAAAVAGAGGRWLTRWLGRGWDEIPLFELLVHAVERFPERLDHIERLLEDLEEQRAVVLPPHFEEIWTPIWACRERNRS